MAAVDPIVYAQLCKLFPVLTAKQATNCCFYSIGANYLETSFLQDATASAIRRSLESAQKKLNANTLPTIRNVFWSAFVVKQIFNKYLPDRNLSSDSFHVLASLFPELNLSQIATVVIFSSGLNKEQVAYQIGASTDIVERYIYESISLLEAESEFLLKILVISRLVLDLT